MRFTTPTHILIALLLSSAPAWLTCGPRGERIPSPPATGVDGPSPAGWKRYDFQKPLAFSVLLPGEPEQKVSPLLDGKEISHVFISADNSGVYGATYISDVPAVASRWESSGDEFFYELFVEHFAAKMTQGGGAQSADFDSELRFTAGRQVTVNGAEGLERDFSTKGYQGRLRLVRVGSAGFCLVALWKHTAPPAGRDAFFNSARIAAG